MSEPRLTPELRQAVADRAEGCCEYCWSQARYATQAFSVEHIVPRAKGGASTLDNLALSCQGCNNHKHNKTEGVDPINHAVVPLYHPRNQRWRDHFVWSDDYTLIVGVTPIDWATVETLRLNRPGVVNLRRILYRAGEHPPWIAQQEPE